MAEGASRGAAEDARSRSTHHHLTANEGGRDSGAGEGYGFRATARNERCPALPVGLRAIGKTGRAQTGSRQAHHLPTCRTSQPNPATFKQREFGEPNSRVAFGRSSGAIYLYGGTKGESGPLYVMNPTDSSLKRRRMATPLVRRTFATRPQIPKKVSVLFRRGLSVRFCVAD